MFKLKSMANEGGAVIEGGSGGASTPPAPAGDEAPKGNEQGKTFTQAELDQIIADRLNREQRKFVDYDTLKAKASELDDIKAAQATETEKAVKAAEASTRTAVAIEFGEKAARATILAHLKAASVEAKDAKALVDDLNLRKYVTDDGDLDEDAINATLERIAPKQKKVDLGQGARGDGGARARNLGEAIQARITK